MTQPIGFKTAGEHVVLDGVNEQLLAFVAVLDKIHQQLFATQLVIVCGANHDHCFRGLHSAGKAVDLRTDDKDAESQLVFLTVLSYAAARMPVSVLREDGVPGHPHLHLEWHGE